MQNKNDLSMIMVKTNTVFFINNFIEYVGKTVLKCCLKKSSKQKFYENNALSLFVAGMLKTLNTESLSLKSNYTKEFNRFIYSSYIKSYFLPVAHELASSYKEQLGLLETSDNGVIKFAHYIAKRCISILKTTDNIETIFNQTNYPVDKLPLKSFFVLAAINNPLKIKSDKSLSLISNQDVSISKFMSKIGLRHQIRTGNLSAINRYQYYIPAKNKIENITYGSRNSFYNEVIDKNAFEPIKTENEIPKEHSHIIFATSDDVCDYLKSYRNEDPEDYGFGIDGFVSYMSNTYFKGDTNITVHCTLLDFQGSNMSMANFDGVIFNQCNFNNTKLNEASFNECAIFDCQFQGTVLNKTQFNKSKLNFIDLSQTIFETDNSFANSMMKFATLEGLALKNANFHGVDLTGSNNIETNFSKANTKFLSTIGCISISTDCSKNQVPKEHILLQSLPFQPYQINQSSDGVIPLMYELFGDGSLSEHSNNNNTIMVESNMLSKLAYGLHATGESKQILHVNNVYSCKKMNRKDAKDYFFKVLNNIEEIKIKPQSNYIDALSNIEHDKFIADIFDKNAEEIDAYAEVLSQEIFNYDRMHFTTLKFYELMQEAINAKEKKPSPCFTAMQTFSDKLIYRINQDTFDEKMTDASRIKILQLYMHTAIKLCHAPYKDLQSASWIIQALLPCSLKHSELSENDNKLRDQLFQYISPFRNFHELRLLVDDRSIPFLPLITRDILMSIEENGKKSYLEQLISLGSIQQEILAQQKHINEIKEISAKTCIISDFIPTTNNISSDAVQSFMQGDDHDPAVSSNETKIECNPAKTNRTRKRLSTRGVSKFFARRDDLKISDLNDSQANCDDTKSSPTYKQG